jgi:V8-like Glu-specific endopeptidase
MTSRTQAWVLSFALLLIASTAKGITYGQADEDRHPYVGALIANYTGSGPALLCSGTLIAPTVFLTAAHCTAYLQSLGIDEVWVTFDAQYTSSSTLIPGTMHTNPAYTWRQSDPGDVAVVVLSSEPVGISPAGLPTQSLLDQLEKSHALRGQTFTAVGYGSLQPNIGGGPPTFTYPDVRKYSVSTFDALNPAWLRLSQNPARGNGGACYGDSGGPIFFGNTETVVAITITGDAMCRATNVTYRLDTPSVRKFLSEYVTLP